MQITSSVFNHNQSIPEKYTCDGENISPNLSFNDIPEKAQSLALIVEDPDAPAGLWIHWTLWNITPDTTTISEGSTPKGATEGITSFGNTGYGGPCPPDKEHRYVFKLYALDTTLELDSTATKENLDNAMQGHILDTAELIGLYERKKGPE
jgi:Raf kinase inhibitor-like YbhB/YbcL family protein